MNELQKKRTNEFFEKAHILKDADLDLEFFLDEAMATYIEFHYENESIPLLSPFEIIERELEMVSNGYLSYFMQVLDEAHRSTLHKEYPNIFPPLGYWTDDDYQKLSWWMEENATILEMLYTHDFELMLQYLRVTYWDEEEGKQVMPHVTSVW